MKDWEFLIQKEGDRQWHLLQSRLGSLTTGRYRMVARTPYPERAWTIQVSHQDGIAGETDQRIALKASRRTNYEGLMMVFPYHDFPAGNWQVSFTCQRSEDLEDLSDGVIEPEPKAIAFSVSDFQVIDFQANLNNTTPIDPEQPNSLPPSAEQSLGHQLSDSAILPTLLAPPQPSLPTSFPLTLTLERNEFSDLGESFLLLAGKVDNLSRDRLFEFPARLRYRLQDLDVAEYIVDESKSWLPILGNILPFTFQETLILPLTQRTDFLGEVLLETEAGEILAQALFSLTLSDPNLGAAETEKDAINYTIQLSNLENHSSFTFEVVVPKEVVKNSLNVDLPDPTKMNRLLKRSRLSDRQVLPPKIEPILAQSSPPKTLKLPNISLS
jgi:hypothetical protein